MLKIAIDAMGGDNGPAPIVEGVIEALKKDRHFVAVLVGKKDELLPLIPLKYKSRIEFCEANDVISMSDMATDALKRKDSSAYKAIELVRNNEAQAYVSAGHSGASMSLATLRIGRIKGVSRPAIATLMPTVNGTTLVLDVGANVDCDAKNLQEFAIMGQVYAEDVLGVENPMTGLLSNGEEETKVNLS
jgi:glycerol-3-phosphate acyltransferase PlsX